MEDIQGMGKVDMDRTVVTTHSLPFMVLASQWPLVLPLIWPDVTLNTAHQFLYK
jgi:hypothetical protein